MSQQLETLKWFLEIEGNEMTPELKRAVRYFVEREPMVQRMIDRIDPDDPIDYGDPISHGWMREMESDARALRDFEVKA